MMVQGISPVLIWAINVAYKRKTWDTISFVIPFPRSSFLLPDIQIFGYSF